MTKTSNGNKYTDDDVLMTSAGIGEYLNELDIVTNKPFGNNVTIISTATTTVIKTDSGVIHAIYVLGGTLGAVTGYDNSAASGQMNIPTFTPVVGQRLGDDEGFTTGQTIVTATAMLLKVIWR